MIIKERKTVITTRTIEHSDTEECPLCELGYEHNQETWIQDELPF